LDIDLTNAGFTIDRVSNYTTSPVEEIDKNIIDLLKKKSPDAIFVYSSKSAKNFKLVSVTENRIINKKVSGLRPQLNSEYAFKNANIIIDFTIPKCTLEVLKIASKLKKRMIIGTTGFSKKEENSIKKYSRKIPILKAGNMSLGINLLMYLTEIALNP